MVEMNGNNVIMEAVTEAQSWAEDRDVDKLPRST